MTSLQRETHVIHDGEHRCPTYSGRTIGCRIRILRTRWNTIVIATDKSDSIYSSITLHTEELAAAICDSFGISTDRLIWIEHIPTRLDLGRPDDLYDLVHFEERNGVIERPFWTPLTAEEVAVLTDGHIAAPSLVE